MRIFGTLVLVGVLFESALAVTPDSFVDYVESTGNQYVDLQVIAAGHLRSEVEVGWTAPSVDTSLLAAREGDVRFFLVHSTSSRLSYGYNAFTQLNFSHPTNGTPCRIISDFSGEGLTVVAAGNRLVENVVPAQAVNLSLSLYLFACNRDGAASWRTKARVYKLKLWKNGELVRELKPCVHNGVAGLYDTVSDQIFYSATSTPLVAAPVRSPIQPAAYLEYLESDGTQYVDTGILGINGVKAELDVAMTIPNEDVTLLGTYSSSSGRFYVLHNYRTRLAVGYGTYLSSWPIDESNESYLLTTNRVTLTGELSDGLQRLSVNDEVYLSTNIHMNVLYPRTLYLYGCNYYDGTARFLASMRVYRAKIWQDDELVRDLRPCLYAGQAGFIDEVSGRFFTSAVPFRPAGYGRLVGTFSEGIKPEQHLEYVASDGTVKSGACIDTGVRARSGVRMLTTMLWDKVPTDGDYLGARKGDTRFYLYHHYQGHMLGYGHYSAYQTKVEAETNVRYRVESELKVGKQSITVAARDTDGWTQVAALTQNATTELDTELNFYLFACNKDGTPQYPGKSRCYGLKLWQDDVLVRDFEPVSYAGLPLLWDKVNKRLYDSIGAGRLIGGPVTSPYEAGFTVFLK